MLKLLEGKGERDHNTEGQNNKFKATGLDFQRLKELTNVAACLVRAEAFFYVISEQKQFVLLFSVKCSATQINGLTAILESVMKDAFFFAQPYAVDISGYALPFSSFYAVPVYNLTGQIHGIAGLLSSEPVIESEEISGHLRVISEQITQVLQLSDLREQLNNKNRKQKLQTKRISEYENILHYTNENSPIGIIQCTVEGQITAANSFFRSLTNADQSTLQKSKWYNYVIQEQREEIIAEWKKQAGQINMFSAQCRFAGPADSVKTASISGRPIVTIDGSVRYLLFVTDLTQQLHEEEQSRQLRHRDLQIIHQKERFIANVSHEIRMPMSAIIGFADILMQQSVEPKQREYVEIIRNAGENLLSIINGILDFSKTEADVMRSGSRDFKIADIRKDVYDLLRIKAEQKKLTFLFLLDENIPECITGDYTHLSQVLINLTGNAIKFTEKGYVALEINLIEKDDFHCKLQFRIKDTGPGIPFKLQKMIFERYYQVDSTTGGSNPGTGLGLSISRSLIEQMGGSIDLISEEGAGAEFVFTLSFVIPQALPAAVEDQILPSFKNPEQIRVLIFEDNELNRHLLHHLMAEFRFSYDIAGNGVEGLSLLCQKSYDLIFMDLEMPVMDGYTTTQEVRQQLKLSVPIIAMTAHTMSGERKRCLELGMNDFVSKPISQSQMLKIIHRYSEGNSNDADRKEYVQNRADLSYLHSISKGNTDFEQQMISLFIQTAPGKIVQLQQYIQSGEAHQIRKLTHQLKGSMQIMGLTSGLQYMEKIDHIVEHQDQQEKAQEYCDQILQMTEDYIKLLQSEIENPVDSNPGFAEKSSQRAGQFKEYSSEVFSQKV